MANGKIQPEFIDTLRAVGKWVDTYGEAIYGTRGGMLAPQSWGVSTQKDDIHYLHVLELSGNPLFIRNVDRPLISAKYLDSNEEVRFKQIEEGLFLFLDEGQLHPIDTILELEFGPTSSSTR